VNSVNHGKRVVTVTRHDLEEFDNLANGTEEGG